MGPTLRGWLLSWGYILSSVSVSSLNCLVSPEFLKSRIQFGSSPCLFPVCLGYVDSLAVFK
jgi:hypothetical protein